MSKNDGLDDFRIGRERHPLRSLLIVLGVVFVGGLMGGTYLYQHKADRVALERLDEFRAAYTRCDARFGDNTSPLLRKLYLDSTRLQSVVNQELLALTDGATCEQVHDALRTADFPLPPPLTMNSPSTDNAIAGNAAAQ